jgi:modification methylase
MAETICGQPRTLHYSKLARLVRMFSFAGDTVLDPFAGTGTTALAAMACGRNSISVEIEEKYLAMAEQRLRDAAWLPRETGATDARVVCK